MNESNIATIRKTISEASKIAVFTFLGNDVILLIIIIITLYYLPEKNKLIIFPSGFTHIHRGNPPLTGSKLYMTGYFIETGAF